MPTLLILAAGRGSRFGGPKQLTPVGPSDEPLLAYTIHDAARAGFGRVVLVCPPDLGPSMSDTFRQVTGGVLEVLAVEQTGGLAENQGRTKPWGTGHAVLDARNALEGTPFGVANGDDWYGPSALAKLGHALGQEGRVRHLAITYALAHTMVFTDGVSRGRCDVRGGTLRGVEEIFDIRRGEKFYKGRRLDGHIVELKPDAPVSMNLWGFIPPFLDHLQGRWEAFQKNQSAAQRESSPDTDAEFLLPSALTELVDAGLAEVDVIPTDERPFGLTRTEDLDRVRSEIKRLVAEGIYPTDLRSGLT